MSWFNEGYETVEKESKLLDEKMNQNFIPNFMLRDGDDAVVVFLTEKPINYYEHYVKPLNRYFTCSQDGNCPLCDTGNKASFRGAYLVLDTRYEEFSKRDGTQVKQQNTVKVMKQGIKALKQIKKQADKRGLLNHAWEIGRTGNGTDTAYSFIPEDLDDVVAKVDKMPTEEEIKSARETMLDNLKPKSREFILDTLAGRTPQNNGGGGSNVTPPNSNPDVKTEGDEEEGGVLRFL